MSGAKLCSCHNLPINAKYSSFYFILFYYNIYLVIVKVTLPT
jgi:hypothetical protein